MVKTSDSNQESRKTIITALKNHNIDVLTAKDVPKLGEPQTTIHAIRMASFIIIDITGNYYDGIIALGICRALNLGNVMMLARMDEDLPMWDGPKYFWSADENLMIQGIQDEVAGFVKSTQVMV